MPRRRVIAKREVLPDPKFNNQVVAKFINHVMVSGKKLLQKDIVYGAWIAFKRGIMQTQSKSLKSAGSDRSMVEVKSRRVGGATIRSQ